MVDLKDLLSNAPPYIYIYIYIERERERERNGRFWWIWQDDKN